MGDGLLDIKVVLVCSCLTLLNCSLALVKEPFNEAVLDLEFCLETSAHQSKNAAN